MNLKRLQTKRSTFDFHRFLSLASFFVSMRLCFWLMNIKLIFMVMQSEVAQR